MKEDWLGELSELAAAERLWSPGDTIVVAVSGGPDSTALLHLLHRLAPGQRLTLVAAHVDHGFRGEESAREAEAVRRFAAGLGVPCESAFIDVPAYIEETGLNPQAAARERRYAFLCETAVRRGASRIALAHHADDQAETVMMRILRGTGPGGLAGIPLRRPEKNVELIRPLLRKYKADILRYCEHWGLTYSRDSSNDKRTYVRNSVRLDVLPYLARFNPRLSEALVRLSELAAVEDDWMEGEARAAWKRCVEPCREGCQMTRKALLGLHVALQRRLIKLILNCVGMETETISFDSVETIRQAAMDGAASTWSFDAGDGVRFVREYDKLLFVRAECGGAILRDGGYEYTAQEDTTVLLVPEGGVRIGLELASVHGGGRPADVMESLFDADRLKWPLRVRNRRPGDRMRVLGLNGSKKVQDMFVDGRIAPSLRERMPLLFDGDGKLLWIPGVRRSEHAQVTASTRRILRVRADFMHAGGDVFE